MAKLNTYPLRGEMVATLQLVGLIPGTGDAFETVRVSQQALIDLIVANAGQDGENGKQIELRKGSLNIEWRYVGDSSWTALVALADLKGDKGDAGERVMLQKSSTAIQWKYESGATWTDLVLLADIRGTNGTNGRTMWPVSGIPSSALGVDGDFANDSNASVMYGPKTSGAWGAGVSYKGAKGDTGTGLKNRGAWVTGTTYQPGDYVFSTGSSTSSSMWILNGELPYVSNTLPKDDPSKWVEFVAPAGADGVNGKNVEMRKTSTTIEWRLVGDADWITLVSLADLKGDQGNPGNPGAAGKTMLSVTAAPSNTLGVDGDWANDGTNFIMYGPKAGGVWPAGNSYKGTNGTPGTNGNKWLSGTSAPSAGAGADGDYYFNTTTSDVYGPKTAGAWGSIITNLKGLKGDPGTAGQGVPTGGAIGQMLRKRSATNYDTEWVDPPSGGGGGVTLETAQTISGMKTFTGGTKLSGVTEIAGGTLLVSAALRKAGPAEGGTWSPTAGVSQQVATMAADINAATIVFPNDPVTGIEITMYFEKEIKSVTWVGGNMWGGSQNLTVVGGPASLRAGGHTFRMILAETPSWYYLGAGQSGSITTVVDGFTVTKFEDGRMTMTGDLPTTASIAANTSVNISATLPAGFINTSSMFAKMQVAGNVTVDHYGVCNTYIASTTQVNFGLRNGGSAQQFLPKVQIDGRWK